MNQVEIPEDNEDDERDRQHHLRRVCQRSLGLEAVERVADKAACGNDPDDLIQKWQVVLFQTGTVAGSSVLQEYNFVPSFAEPNE